MLQAQLHGKVPERFEGMEDVLTASTFGVLPYLPAPLSRDILAELLHEPLPDGELVFRLWPRFATPTGFRRAPLPLQDADEGEDEGAGVRGQTEPDVLIEAGELLILVEAKYHAGLDPLADQLGREFAVGYRAKARQFRLLVITGQPVRPRPGGQALAEGVRAALGRAALGRAATGREPTSGGVTSGGAKGLGKAAAREMQEAVDECLRWTNWQAFHPLLAEMLRRPALAQHTRCLLTDVKELLELRGLVPYEGAGLRRMMAQWDASPAREGFPGLPVEFRFAMAASLGASSKRLAGFDLAPLAGPTWRMAGEPAPRRWPTLDASLFAPPRWRYRAEEGTHGR